MEILTAKLHPRFGAVRAILALGLIFSASAPGQVDEYRLKAAFLYNFAKFVEWPSQTFKNPADPIAICVLGRDPFGNALGDLINGKIVGGRALVARQVSDSQAARGCPILFVAASETKRFRAMVESLKDSGILSVGETEGFATDGGVINFKVDHGSVRLEINTDAADVAQVHISSKLLSLAQIVRRSR